MLIEMPVLDNAIPACGAAFTPLLFALTFGEPVMKVVSRGARAVPRNRVPFMAELLLDWLAQDPGPSGAVLQGILFGRTAPEHAVRCQLETPALVIGHPRDPVHPFSDADMLAAELPNATLLDANSILELRTHPQRLTTRIAAFVDECWAGADEVGLRRAAAGA
jgi:pimeloyl-ACP methyl ester carboxylesterase